MAIHPIHGVGGTSGPAGPASQAGGAGAASHRPSDTVDVSPEAALLRRLDALALGSPGRFRAVAQGVAARLDAEARVADPVRALPLAVLAERFAAAAIAGTPAPLTAAVSAAIRVPAAPPAPVPAAPGAVPPEAALAAAALAAGAAAQAKAKLDRTRRRVAYRPQRQGGGARADEPAASAASPLGLLLAAVREIVEWAIDAALREAPPERS